MLDAARDFQRNQLGGERGSIPSPSMEPCLEVLIRNDTGDALDAGAVVKLSSPIVSAVDHPEAVRGRPVFSAQTPTAAGDAIAILSQPIPDEAFGRAVVEGIAVLDVYVHQSGHTHAIPVAGETVPDSAPAGPMRILWKESGDDALKRCIVAVGNVPARFPVTIAGGGSDGNGHTAYSWTLDALSATGAWAASSPTVVGTLDAYPTDIYSGSVLITNVPVARVGSRVWMEPTAKGKLAFVLNQYADWTGGSDYVPGLVSTEEQTFKGDKTFEDDIDVNGSATVEGNIHSLEGNIVAVEGVIQAGASEETGGSFNCQGINGVTTSIRVMTMAPSLATEWEPSGAVWSIVSRGGIIVGVVEDGAMDPPPFTGSFP